MKRQTEKIFGQIGATETSSRVWEWDVFEVEKVKRRKKNLFLKKVVSEKKKSKQLEEESQKRSDNKKS